MPLVDFSLTLLSADDTPPACTGSPYVGADATDNVAELILRHARVAPQRIAFVTPQAEQISYGTLAARVAGFARALERGGVGAGDRVLVLLPMSTELYALAIAVLARGAIVTLVDGRLSRHRLRAAVADAGAHAVVATPAVMRWWPLIPAFRRASRFTVGARTLGCTMLRIVDERRAQRRPLARVRADHPAIVSFTSGSTGRAKAIVRTHGVLVAQHEALASAFPGSADDVNLPGFPMAALHNLCCGATTVLPPAAPRGRRDAAAAAQQTLALVRQHGVTSLSAAPAALEALATAVLRARRPVPTLRRIVVGGGPVSRRLCDLVLRAFPGADSQILYGATEAEPIATISMAEALVARGTGYLVGRPAGATEIAVASVDGTSVGEVIVRGRHVISASASAVRRRASGRAWHATGDIGAFDARGRLWLLGRVGSSVRQLGGELHPYAVEAEVGAIDGVCGAALVAHAAMPEGELALQLAAGADPGETVRTARARLAALGGTALPIRVCAELPMDERHGSKVVREELARRLARSAR